MKIYSLIFLGAFSLTAMFFSECVQKSTADETSAREPERPDFNGYESQAKWGEHLVTIAGCNDCHSPKKMTAQGPEIDSSLLLSGHPSQLPPPDVNRKDLEAKGFTLTNDLTAWVGGWGISYAANLTSDSTGIGEWKENQFIYAIREGKNKGIAGARPLLPPMPWTMYMHMTDNELKAIFAYLKSTKPIHNIVPSPVAPALARQ